ncbi:MAG: hypothetical protein M3430_14170, partial [Acidobacteriota bacterium]|nr:hypothetical protein [Acidobacteriota bacterium]
MPQTTRRRRVGAPVRPRPSLISVPASAPPLPMTLATPVAARPRTVNTLPPADTFADLPVDTIPGDVTAMPPTPQAFLRGAGGATMMESRARGVTPRFSDDPLTSLPARIEYEQANPATDTNGRGRSFLSMLLRALPASMGQSQQLSAQRGTAYG